jgi:omega-amidase
MEDLNITLVQTTLHWADVEANIEMLTQKIAGISNQTDLVILPETFSTGFSMNARQHAEEVSDSKAIKWMKTAAQQKNCVITGSLLLREGERFFNRLIWMRPDGSYEYYNKRHLFSYAHEDENYTPGEERLVVELKGWKIRPLICYDLRFPVWSRNLDENGEPEYDALLYVANWPERRIYAWKHLLIARAIENQAYVIGLNRTGNDGNDIYYSGDSMVIDALGQPLYHKMQDEDVFTLELNYDALQKVRETFQFLKDGDAFSLNKKLKIAGH